ncbi:MAG: translation elongation factor [Peptococcaceae bacterium BICA1-8]|nr:MAG: translation elongation factor [Peptococcaceae bacterium BICA1-8]
MKNVVMGTAGHIDHGKTALVKQLTGIDTDRLEEEKRRGMTIELGFAPLTLPSGNIISIIDVPGHEKFVKTMVAGVTGIDFVTLVVAADEGVMPQTLEHIDILSLLNVNAGVVALTKTDLVDEEWLEMVKGDIFEALSGTTLERISLVPVSSVTGYGIDKLVEKLEQLTAEASTGESQTIFRLPVDRVFPMIGYGTVITGTVSGGLISKGDGVEILPKGLTARVRGIQVHNSSVNRAGAGDRCALNLSGVDRDSIKRGDVVANQGIITPTKIVDAVIYTVKGKNDVLHNQRVHVHIGTKEALARVKILGEDKIPGGSKGYIQLKFEEPVAVIREDRFIIRAYSPVATLGGGWIIFHSPKNRKRFSEDSMEALIIGESGSLQELVHYNLKNSGKILSVNDLWREIFADKEEIQRVLIVELRLGNILWLEEINKYLSKDLYYDLYKKINTEFEQMYKKYPYRYQLDKEEVKSKAFNSLDSKDFAALLNCFVLDNRFELEGNALIQPGKTAINRIFAMKDVIMLEKLLLEDGLNTSNVQQLKKDLNIDENKLLEIERFLKQTSRIIDLGEGILIHCITFVDSVKKVRSILDEYGTVTAAQVRDYLGVGRKTAIALLEYLDRLQITQRMDNVRKPGSHYMDEVN